MPLEFTFDARSHICRLANGSFCPTVTQMLEAQGLCFDFKRFVDSDVLDRRSRIGTEVHDLTDTLDKDGEIPETWLTEETAGYVESWRKFKATARFEPTEWSVRMAESINGFPLSGELDNYGLIAGKYPAIIDKKTGVKAESHAIQLGCYEMLRFRSPRIGRVIRAVAQLSADGSCGKLIEYPEHSPVDGLSYAETALCALQNLHWRLRRGLLREEDFTER